MGFSDFFCWMSWYLIRWYGIDCINQIIHSSITIDGIIYILFKNILQIIGSPNNYKPHFIFFNSVLYLLGQAAMIDDDWVCFTYWILIILLVLYNWAKNGKTHHVSLTLFNFNHPFYTHYIHFITNIINLIIHHNSICC